VLRVSSDVRHCAILVHHAYTVFQRLYDDKVSVVSATVLRRHSLPVPDEDLLPYGLAVQVPVTCEHEGRAFLYRECACLIQSLLHQDNFLGLSKHAVPPHVRVEITNQHLAESRVIGDDGLKLPPYQGLGAV
jgi:hypothetical protein